MDYKDTLNLPKTDYPMKANLPNMEPEMLKKWEEEDIYNKIMEARKDAETFILHDGPPYANGHIHLGTSFNKVLKDFIVKYKTMAGFRSPYIPGWDCHGMPIEHNVTKDLGDKAREIPKTILRKKCRSYADKFVGVQKKEFRRLGVFGDWEHPYITMSNDYESDIVRNFGTMVEKGYIYRGLRPIHWCPKCQTALAGNEIEYDDRESPSIYVRLKIRGSDNRYLLIWTTTPWTLPANVAAAFHPQEQYVEIKYREGTLILAEKLLEQVAKKLGIEKPEIIEKNDSSYYSDIEYEHPISHDKTGKVVYADYVTMDTGSGIVHTAPGHGYDDYQTGIKHNLDIVSPVDKQGRFTDYVKKYEGQFVFDANKSIMKDLEEEGILLYFEKISHSYPVCWRCKSELIFRATEQWFLNVEHEDLRKRLLEEIDRVKWIPGWSHDRIYNMVEVRPDWCLSRQRSWGVPIPVLYCKDCGEPLLDKAFIDRIADMFLEKGSDIWFEADIKDLSGDFKCKKCGSSDFERETNIFDVWFDASLSHSAVVKKRKELTWPSDLYLEAVDQHRGWFQVALIVSTATEGKAPYREVLTHGLILDKNMKKMSKSLGNIVSPEAIWKKYGSEILRLWFASIDYTSDSAFGEELLKGSLDTYRRVRNTFKFILGNLNGFEYDKHAVKYEDMLDIDKYILHKLYTLQEKLTESYDAYQFHKVFRDFHTFCTNDLSSFYLDIIKDRLYTYKTNGRERRSGQTAIYHLLDVMLKLIAPIMPFTAEQTYGYFDKSGKLDSVHMETYCDISQYKNEELAAEWKILTNVRETVNIALEKLRSDNIIGKALEAEIVLYTEDSSLRELLNKYIDILPQLFIVSGVKLSDLKPDIVQAENEDLKLYAGAVKSDESKCERCWVYSDTVGKDSEHPSLCDKCADAVKAEV